MDDDKKAEARRVVKELGGPTKVGKLFGISKGAVSQWHTNGIPNPWMRCIRAQRPDLFKAGAEPKTKRISQAKPPH